MSRRQREPVVLRPSQIAELGLSPEVDAPANAWLNRIFRAEDRKAARQARDDAQDFVVGLEQRQSISIVQADQLYTAIEQQWYDRLGALEAGIEDVT